MMDSQGAASRETVRRRLAENDLEPGRKDIWRRLPENRLQKNRK